MFLRELLLRTPRPSRTTALAAALRAVFFFELPVFLEAARLTLAVFFRGVLVAFFRGLAEVFLEAGFLRAGVVFDFFLGALFLGMELGVQRKGVPDRTSGNGRARRVKLVGYSSQELHQSF